MGIHIKKEREEEKRVTVSFGRDTFCGSAVIIDGKLEKLALNPWGHSFYRWFKTKDRLHLLQRFLIAIEKEIVYEEREIR